MWLKKSQVVDLELKEEEVCDIGGSCIALYVTSRYDFYIKISYLTDVLIAWPHSNEHAQVKLL